MLISRMLFIFLLVTSACQRTEPAAIGKDADFYYEPVGWRFSIPAGWQKRSESQIAAVKSSGRELVEESQGQKFSEEDLASVQTVLYLEDDAGNKFTSDIQAVGDESPEAYAQSQKEQYDVLEKAFRDKGLNIATRRGQEVIDSIVFATFEVDIYAGDSDQLVARSKMYDARIGDFSLLISYTCKDEKPLLTIAKAISQSTFGDK